MSQREWPGFHIHAYLSLMMRQQSKLTIITRTPEALCKDLLAAAAVLGVFTGCVQMNKLPVISILLMKVTQRGTAQALRPCTCKQLNEATQLHSEAEWTIDEVEIGQVLSRNLT